MARRSSLRHLVEWWIDALADGLEALPSAGRAGRPVIFRPDADGYAILEPGRAGPRRIGRLNQDALNQGALNQDALNQDAGVWCLDPATLAPALAGRPLALEIPGDWLFEQTLEPLPKESEPVIPGIVRHQIERVTPFCADDTLYTCATAPCPDDPGRLLVTVRLVPRALLAGPLAALAELRPRRLSLRVPRPDGSLCVLPVLREGERKRRLGRRRRMALALGALMAAMVASLMWAGVRLSDLETETEALQTRIAERTRVAKALYRDGERPDPDRAARVRARKDLTPPAVLVLEALSERLPDDAWLTELHLAGTRLRISGFARQVNRLIPALAGTAPFESAVFSAPTTRLGAAQGDNFHIEITVQGGDGAEPEGLAP